MITRRHRLDTRRLGIAIYAAASLVATIVVFLHSLSWVGSTFPGFFVMDNRVVPSVGLQHWTGIVAGKRHNESIYQHQVLIVDGEEVATAQAVYDHVAMSPPDTTHRYMFRDLADLDVWNIASMRFAVSDYLSVFGAYLLNCLIFTAVGLAVWMYGPRAPTTTGTIVLALDLGVFCLTAMDLYGPSHLFRLHVASEAIFPAALLHLTLVFPVVRLGRWRRHVLTAIYLADAVLIGVYQRFLYQPGTYSSIHNFCMAAAGLAGVVLIGSCIQAYATSTSLLVRKRIGIVLTGILAGFAIPAWMLTVSGLSGGDRAINLAAFTAPLFPLSLAYAVVKHDLFEIDAMLRRALSYLLITGTVVAIYGALVFGLGLVLQTTSPAYSALVPLIFSVLMVSLFNPMRDRIQHVVDRIYYRISYNAQKTLERASGALVSTLNLDDLSTLAVETIASALLIDEASIWLHTEDRGFEMVRGHGWTEGPSTIPSDDPLIERLRSGRRAVTVYDFNEDAPADAAASACTAMLERLHAQLVLALTVRGELIGVIALGEKKSQTIFTLDDLDFLSTFANQVAVAIVNAQAYHKIGELNASLEHKVEQRTGELAQTNGDLARSLRDLEQAYDEVQRSQENLLRAEKMAALGRLTAGIAHEVNTPLGASLNSLKIMEELVHEYRDSIGDASVNERDHREIASELETLVGHVFKWTTKAAGYIRSVKAHTRSGEAGVQERSFDVCQLIEDTRLLLSHRLRLSACTVTVACRASVMLYGDPGRLGQVLTNLLTNAIDAYEGHGMAEGVIGIDVVPQPDHVEISVEDEGSGIAPEHLERIFEELFTTKPPGKGTGLGLPISRDILTECFGGRMEVVSEAGKGSRFTLIIPRRDSVEPAVAEERAAIPA